MRKELISIENYLDSSLEEETEGSLITDITTVPPLYAVVEYEGRSYLSSVTVDPEANVVDFGHEIELNGSARVVSLGERVLSLSQSESPTLTLFDTESHEIEVEQQLAITDPVELTHIQSL